MSRLRLPLLLLAVCALAVGTGAGLARLGLGVPAPLAQQAGVHGPLMAGVFFGTVIGLERALALGRGWAWMAPALAAACGLALLTSVHPGSGPLADTLAACAPPLLVAAAAVLLAASLQVFAQQPALFTGTLVAGAALWLLGAVAWWAAGTPVAAVAPWLGFLILTIAGERLELTRLLPPSGGARAAFVAACAVLAAGALAALLVPAPGLALFGLGALLLALWLMLRDIARRTVRSPGVTRFIALALLAGYAWLALGGALALTGALMPGAALRDAALHAIALGFVMSMVFGHAPVIVPAITRRRLAFGPVFYLPLALLHGALAVRVAAALAGLPALQRSAALASAGALALFAMVLLAALARGRSPHRAAAPALS